MSFLDSVLTSLETGKPTKLPVSQPPSPPKISSPKRDDRKLGSFPQHVSTMNAGTKRKAEDQLPRPVRPEGSVSTKSGAKPGASSATSKTAPKPISATKPVPKNSTVGVKKTAPTKPVSTKSVPSKTAVAAPPAKAPPKGSYADLMAIAKARQEQAPQKVGLLQHQTAPREHLGRHELRRRLQEAKMRAKMESKGKKFEPAIARNGHKRSPDSAKQSPEVPSYKGTAKPARTPEPPTYQGTARLPGKPGTNDRRQHGKRRMNEYMGTDEEDEGDYGGYDDYYSDASSDMEAGFDDVELEEGAALKNARKEDEEELRLEMAAKKEKLARQQKLAALASRKR
ncbi:Chromatin SPT2 [Penicillium longicatenatum]|uniref:Chromatin SPT2 n=1 Tax=Penicillium longicatenatum TaxID=1561947 RepID=UPI0025474628|nr:Chromatin SPT2 [Penicillium longicatenatum]KAJ5635058.1 Chromatin SPT2 [Penicillium longicatenatum]